MLAEWMISIQGLVSKSYTPFFSVSVIENVQLMALLS